MCKAQLPKRIHSILDQSFQDFELLLLDDASSDGSAAVLAEYAEHPRVARVIVNEANTGSPYRRWNRGAREARGEYLWLAESDDYADPSFLERTVAVMDAHPHVGLVYCRSFKVDAESRVFGSTADWTASLHPTRWESDYVNDGRDECARYLIRRCIIPNVSPALLLVDALKRVGYAHDAMRFCGDYATYVRMLQVADIAYLATPLNYFRFSDSSVRTQMSKAWLHDFEKAEIMAYIFRHFDVPPDARILAIDEFLEQLIRACLRGPAGARSYLSGYGPMRRVVREFCPQPETRSLLILAAQARRRANRLVRQARAADQRCTVVCRTTRAALFATARPYVSGPE